MGGVGKRRSRRSSWAIIKEVPTSPPEAPAWGDSLDLTKEIWDAKQIPSWRDDLLQGLGSYDPCVTSTQGVQGKHQTWPQPLLVSVKSGGSPVKGIEENKVKLDPAFPRPQALLGISLPYPTIKSPSVCNGPCFTPASQISRKLLFRSALAESNRRKSIWGRALIALLNQVNSRTSQHSEWGRLPFPQNGPWSFRPEHFQKHLILCCRESLSERKEGWPGSWIALGLNLVTFCL